MRNKIYIAILLLIVLIACDNAGPRRIIGPQVNDMNIQNLQRFLQKPSKVKYMFSLRDENDHAIVLDKNQLADMDIIIKEDEELLTESSAVIYSSADFKMDIVIVLDFTRSMAPAGGGSYLADMVAGTELIINTLNENHRVALVEFHDTNPTSNYSLIQDFSADKEAVITTLNDFYEEGAYHGYSQCWDAIGLGLSLFSEEEELDKVRSLVFLSDGKDNGSVTTPEELQIQASEKAVRLYNIGVGDIASIDEEILIALSQKSEGHYYASPTAGTLQTSFNLIVADLGGNYIMGYMTPQLGKYSVQIDLEYDNMATTVGIADSIDISEYVDSDRLGLIRFTQAVAIDSLIQFDMYADHIPRGVADFLISIDVPAAWEVQIDIDGGIISHWNDPSLNDGWYRTQGRVLSFGEFGYLGKVEIKADSTLIDTLTNLVIPIIFNNEVYEYGVMFYGGDETEILNNENNWWYTAVSVGKMAGRPLPRHMSTTYGTPVNISWTMFENTRGWMYDVYLDSLHFIDPSYLVAEKLTSPQLTIELPASDSTWYYWKVKFYNESEEVYYSPVWYFLLSDNVEE